MARISELPVIRLMARHRLLRLLAVNAIGGAAVAGLFLGAIIYTDTFRMGTLILKSDSPVLAIIMLYTMLTVTFASVAMGSAIMRLGDHNRDARPRGGTPVFDPQLQPCRIPSTRR
ncbi:MAG: hypothetical protein KDJ77_05245 [Rhodobiaceae bacterium]|nr:hypothetical protein [Rhodobiaceae bacterium]